MNWRCFSQCRCQAKAQAFLEVPNCIDHAVGWSDEFVARCRDVQSEVANSCEFREKCFRIY
jgi:hypothetical protein